MKKQKNSFVVPLVFSLSDFEKDSPLYLWIFELYTNYASRNNSAIISQEFYFDHYINVLEDNYWGGIKDKLAQEELNNRKERYRKYSISNIETKRLMKNKKTAFEAETDLLVNKNKNLISMVEKRLIMIEKDYNRKIDALMVWVSNPSLEELAKKRNIKIISQELSPIRQTPNNNNYNTTLCYFQFKNKYDKDYVKSLFNDFERSIKTEKLQMFSREELLSIFLNTEDLWALNDLKNPTPYDLGLSPGFENDPFFKAYANEDIEETCEKINKMFSPNKVSIRYHPNLENSIGNKLWEKDSSPKSIYWILKCQRIVTAVSNIGFDAMMFGKTCYTLVENMPFAFKSVNSLDWKDESVVDSLYLNFMLFGIFVHWDLMLDQKYIDWRMSNPGILEIFKYNRKYVLESLGLEVNQNWLTQEDILKTVHQIEDKEIKKIIHYNLFDRLEAIKDENETLKQTIEDKNETLKQTIDRLKSIEDENKTLKQTIEDKNETLKQTIDRLKSIEDENKTLQRTVDRLKSIEDENKTLQRTVRLNSKELQKIYNSKSWKVTQPIREFAKMKRDFKTKIFKKDAEQKKP